VAVTEKNPLVEGLERLPVHPTTLVIFGGTGDLAQRKLLPAIYNLAHEGALPERFELVGVARREKEHDDFREECRESIVQYSRREPDAEVRIEVVLSDPGVIAPSTFHVNGQPRPFLALQSRQAGRMRVLSGPAALECQLTSGLYAGLQNSVIRRRVFDLCPDRRSRIEKFPRLTKSSDDRTRTRETANDEQHARRWLASFSS
jgi:hypothetical protein